MDIVLVLYLLGLAAVLFAAYFFFASFVIGAGYQPTPPAVAQRMVEFAQVGPADHVVDLGAGTGALVFLSARQGARVTGVEAEPLRFLLLRFRRATSPDRDRVEILRENMFDFPLQDATVVLMFLWPGAMTKLKPKLEQELVPGARVVSYWHPVPGWTPVKEDPKHRVYYYVSNGAGGTATGDVSQSAS